MFWKTMPDDWSYNGETFVAVFSMARSPSYAQHTYGSDIGRGEIWFKIKTNKQTIRNSLSRSSGAVQVRDMAPAAAPATRWRHQTPVRSSVSVKSSGTVAGSPTSIYHYTHFSFSHFGKCYFPQNLTFSSHKPHKSLLPVSKWWRVLYTLTVTSITTALFYIH